MERIERLEKVVRHIAEDQISLQGIVAELATETRKAFDQVAVKMDRTDEQIRQLAAQGRATDERLAELSRGTAERGRATDERIDKLAAAIGEFIRQNRN